MRTFLVTWRTGWAEALANRKGATTQILVMVTNDVAWIAFWLIFFEEVGAVRGWTEETVILLLAILTTAGGLVLGCLANVRHIGSIVTTGGLDATLVLPGPPLRHLLARRIDAINMGDILFGVVLFAVAGDPTPARTVVFVGVVSLASILLASFLVFASSLAFFVGTDDAGYLGFHSMLLFAAYPVDIFAGVTKLLLYGVVPAGFVASVPARLVEDFDAGLAATLAAVTAVFVTAALVTFRSGLRRYQSGAMWTRA